MNYKIRKKIKKYSNENLYSLRVPVTIESLPKEELENTFREAIKVFKRAVKKYLTPSQALKQILMSTRCFSEIDHNLRIYNINNIPSNASSFLLYQDMSVGFHKTDRDQAFIPCQLRKPVIGKIKISVEHAFMMLVYLAGNETAIGIKRVDKILENMNIPLKYYKYAIVKRKIEKDRDNNILWIYKNVM